MKEEPTYPFQYALKKCLQCVYLLSNTPKENNELKHEGL